MIGYFKLKARNLHSCSILSRNNFQYITNRKRIKYRFQVVKSILALARNKKPDVNFAVRECDHSSKIVKLGRQKSEDRS